MLSPAPRHNGGTRLDEEEDVNKSWRACKTLLREIALRRLARAEELGITYKEYTLEILERGKYL